MREALRGTPDVARPRPAGLVDARIVPRTGLLALDGDGSALVETFLVDHLPAQANAIELPHTPGSTPTNESLF
jgi:hypothetical protein